MKRSVWILTLGLLCAAPAFGQDVQFLGYTSAQPAGNFGLVVLHEECDFTFPNQGAHACTTGELLRAQVSVPRPRDPDPSATNWVLPSIVGTVGTTTALVALDASGKAASPANLSCDGWGSKLSTVTALTINELGQFVLAACSVGRNVACCRSLTPAP